MTDNKENRKSFEEFIAETVERQYNMDAPKTITPQELEERLKKRQKQRRARRLRTVGFAAVFVIAVICTSIGFNALTTNVGADKNDKEEIKTENGVVIEDGGYGGSSEDCVVITEWEEVETIKITNKALMIPKYIPNNFEFDKLTIEHLEDGHIVCEYIFHEANENNILKIEEFITNEGDIYFEVDNVTRVVNCSLGDIFIQEGEKKIATIQTDDGLNINIWSTLSDDEIINIINSLSD